MKLEYDNISPVTGNKCVLAEANTSDGSESYLCMESGFTSHENLINESEFQQRYEKNLTELMINCKIVDSDNRVWYPTFMQLPGGMLYAEGESSQSWYWKVAQIIPLEGDERLNYPKVGKEDEYHTARLDVENAKTYDKNKFESALEELYAIVKKVYDDKQ